VQDKAIFAAIEINTHCTNNDFHYFVGGMRWEKDFFKEFYYHLSRLYGVIWIFSYENIQILWDVDVLGTPS
jgi:hypothetical protein